MDERVGLRGADDHVGLLAGNRRHNGDTVSPRGPGPEVVVTGCIPLHRRAERAVEEAWRGMDRALQREDRGSDEEQAADEGRHGIPWKAEHERATTDAEGDRLPRPHRNPPEHLLHARLGLNATDEIVRPDGDTARRYEHIRSEPALDRVSVRIEIVLNRRERLHNSAGLCERRGQHDPVGFVDLSRRKRRARPTQLRARRQHRDAWPAGTANGVQSARGESSQVGGRQPHTRSERDAAGRDIASAWPDVVSMRNIRRDLYRCIAMSDNELERHDAVGARGNHSTRSDRHRLAGREGFRSGSPRGYAIHHGQGSRSVSGPDRESVHRRARKRRQVEARASGLRKQTPGGILETHGLGFDDLHPLEHTADRFFHADQRSHTATVDDRFHGYARGVISIVIPVRNEEQSVAVLYDELAAVLGADGRPWEAVFVDDGSIDGTFAGLARLHELHENVRVVRLRRNFGKATALDAGFNESAGEIVVTIDGDLQDDPAEIPRLLAKLDEGFDLVTGWKTSRRDPLTRRLLSRLFNAVTGRVSGLRLHDMNCGLKAYRVGVLRGLRLYGELHRYIPVLAHYRGFRIAELPVNHRPREHGRSRYGMERYLRGFLDLLTVTFMGRYRHRPLHLFGGLGLLLGSAGAAILVYLTVVKLAGHAIGHRPLLTLGVLFVVVGMQFLTLGLMSELITSHHEERAAGHERIQPLVDEVLR